MKVVMLDGYTKNPGDISWENFEALGDFTRYDRTESDFNLTVERIGDAEAIFTNKVKITRDVMKACPKMRYVGVIATGYDIVDLEAARELGVTVTNVPTYGTYGAGQTAIALLLEICHRVGHHNDAVKQGRWESCPDFCFWDYPLIELAGKTMGIIGFGHIGQVTGQIAKAMGMNILAFDVMQTDSGREIAKYASMDEIFAGSDVISLHCPLTKDTRGLINKDNIAKMKDGVIILNNARGPVIVEQDLADALNSGKVYAAGIDVVSVEPIKGDNPLLKAKNSIITPHISGACVDSRIRLMDISVDNLKAYLAGKPVNVVS